jgi:hypothetical protein
MKTKCQTCKYGAVMKDRIFKKVIKKVNNSIIEIDYNNGGVGCRATEDYEKERHCLSNNFNKYAKF